jgi:hypothetical protein
MGVDSQFGAFGIAPFQSTRGELNIIIVTKKPSVQETHKICSRGDASMAVPLLSARRIPRTSCHKHAFRPEAHKFEVLRMADQLFPDVPQSGKRQKQPRQVISNTRDLVAPSEFEI